jgi:hypothetical protein
LILFPQPGGLYLLHFEILVNIYQMFQALYQEKVELKKKDSSILINLPMSLAMNTDEKECAYQII